MLLVDSKESEFDSGTSLQMPLSFLMRNVDRVELPNLARHLPDQLHTSSDGQKFEVRVDSLNAKYSFKYFGKDQGVAAYA
jgi:hypothetical protein